MTIDAEKLGCRSLLVMMKLGFDMRAHYDHVLVDPLPEHLQILADRIEGYAEWTEVGQGAAAEHQANPRT